MKLDQSPVASELLELFLLIGQSPKFVDSFRFGLFKLVYRSTLRFLVFIFFYWFSIFPGYHYVGGRGVLKVDTNKGQSQGQSSPLVPWTAA